MLSIIVKELLPNGATDATIIKTSIKNAVTPAAISQDQFLFQKPRSDLSIGSSITGSIRRSLLASALEAFFSGFFLKDSSGLRFGVFSASFGAAAGCASALSFSDCASLA